MFVPKLQCVYLVLYYSFLTLLTILRIFDMLSAKFTVVRPKIFYPKCPWFAAVKLEMLKFGNKFSYFFQYGSIL